jgi:hypothetical protein
VIDAAVLESPLQSVQQAIVTIKATILKLAPVHTQALAQDIPGVSATSLAIVLCGLTDKHFTNRD